MISKTTDDSSKTLSDYDKLMLIYIAKYYGHDASTIKAIVNDLPLPSKLLTAVESWYRLNGRKLSEKEKFISSKIVPSLNKCEGVYALPQNLKSRLSRFSAVDDKLLFLSFNKIPMFIQDTKKTSQTVDINGKRPFDIDTFDTLSKRLKTMIDKGEISNQTIPSIFERYTRDGYSAWNKLARGEYTLSDKVLKNMKGKAQIDVDNFLMGLMNLTTLRNDLKSQVLTDIPTVYRGMSVARAMKWLEIPQKEFNSLEEEREYIEDYINNRKGKIVISDPAATSTSTVESVALGFNRKYGESSTAIFVITIPAKSAHGRSLIEFSANKEENEILLQPGQKIRIDRCEQDNSEECLRIFATTIGS